MLQELSIRQFAIIDDIRITFEGGLTILSGETGAGNPSSSTPSIFSWGAGHLKR